MEKIFKILANLKFAIALLLLISITITFGSIIEQDQTLDYYKQNYPLTNPIGGFLTWKVINMFQLNHIYKNFWFISLLLSLGISLIACTFFQQFPGIKFSRRCYFSNNPRKTDFQTQLKTNLSRNIIYTIISEGYFVFQQKKNFYGTKGIIGRIAPVFVHLSIILILLGSIFASLGGFNSQELIGKGEIFHIQNVTSSGPLTKLSQQAIRVNDFWINYYPNNKIKQFYSNLSIINGDGQEVRSKTISVNKPLIYKDLTFYQTDWNLLGLRISHNNKNFQIPVIQTTQNLNKVWLTWLPLESNTSKNLSGETIIINNYKGTIYIYDNNGQLNKKIELSNFIENKNYKLIEFLSVTGIQIKSDPGILFIYFGFGFLMVSTILSYLSFSQVWLGIDYLEQNNIKLTVNAKTNRTKVLLTTQMYKITKNKR
jgi:cytochrome c biogenesis protein|uniref:Cytochrome c biogenesis protein Ccs1 n=2 Tax=Heterosigma akashiwo TaxID=2829 RepID=CCS1_HETA4|nr:RecName: Full=Cytochrome c biogenesis protein Ccs1 [Heterosigma akashiwo CCMP452]ABV70165.1 ResB-like protein [Heterosigma akashiwo]BBA18230.1 photosystem I assembly protein Ycf4 [Heterosigma akashiwo]BBA18369.1 photosystem I assembly protein Ycf4 [Heterosigma akashiwo]BBA18508.1 photosystem I assembly protein Ycf4 [Heterosigma akashiwo]BBA18646.1 photosystem I assembly protein Ycf4 [Heterosigma akashiwo]